MPHLFHAVVAAVSLVVFVTMGCVFTMADMDLNPLSQNWGGNGHSKVQVQDSDQTRHTGTLVTSRSGNPFPLTDCCNQSSNLYNFGTTAERLWGVEGQSSMRTCLSCPHS